jgi:head-tail adaptor
MLANRLRHRVSLEALTVEVDSNGHRTETWLPAKAGGRSLKDVPAEVLLGPGRDFIGSSAPQASAFARVNLRWFPATVAELMAMRLVWEKQNFGITSATSDRTARREWRLTVEVGPADGRQ